MAIIPKGKEPERVKKRMETLFAKLDEAYPDKVISGLQKEHKKWAETVTELYRLLGYEDNKSFLEAYGYTYERKGGGRASNDHAAVIEELKNRYPDGSQFHKLSELQNANPDLAGKIKTLSNRSNELFGMALADYLKNIGVLGSTDFKELHKLELDELISSLKSKYVEGTDLPETIAQLKSENDSFPTNRLNYIKEVYGVSPQEYLLQIGLIKKETFEDKLEQLLCELKTRYLNTQILPESLQQICEENPDLPIRAIYDMARASGVSLVERLKDCNLIRSITTLISDEEIDELIECYRMMLFEEVKKCAMYKNDN